VGLYVGLVRSTSFEAGQLGVDNANASGVPKVSTNGAEPPHRSPPTKRGLMPHRRNSLIALNQRIGSQPLRDRTAVPADNFAQSTPVKGCMASIVITGLDKIRGQRVITAAPWQSWPCGSCKHWTTGTSFLGSANPRGAVRLEHSKRRSEAGHGRPSGGGVQVEAEENLSAVVHREQFDSFGGVRPVEPASINPYCACPTCDLMPRRGLSPYTEADPTLFSVTSLLFWQILVPWFRASVATPRDRT
jgi:hypothetical protein